MLKNMSSLENLVGQVLDDKYQIDRQLGQGGMGAVYKATHLGTDRPVALKVIMPQFMEEKRFIERFKREAKAAGRLRHPNVVNVTDFGFADVDNNQIAYLVMEYLDGTTLGDLLEQHKTLPLELIVDIIEQTSLAVNQAHKLGIVHRDLKPDNIWLQPNGRGGYIVKVLDFGLAQIHDLAPKPSQLIVAIAESTNNIDPNAKTQLNIDLEAKTQLKTPTAEINNPSWVTQVEEATLIKHSRHLTPIEEAKTLANNEEVATIINIKKNTGSENHRPKATSPLALDMDKITQVGAILGTPIYMSPEQCQGKPLDFRTDIYSLGVIVYQMLAGVTPFTGKLNKLLEQHINATPPILKNVPPAIAQVVMSALAKDPDKRPVSTLAFAAALKANSEGEPPIIRQALSFYRKNFVIFLKTSLIVYSPYLIFYFLLIGTSLALPIDFLPSKLNYLLTNGYWILGIIALLVAHSTSLGIFALIVEKLHLLPTTEVSLLEILKTYFSQFIKIVITALTGNIKLLLNYSLFAPIILLEKKSGKEALLRSEFLVNQLKPVMLGLQIRSLFVSAITLLAAPINFVAISMFCFILSEDWSKTLMQRGTISAFIFIPSAFILLPGILLILVYPVVAIAQCLFYFKIKLMLGETTSETNQTDQPINLTSSSTKHSTHKRTVAFATVLTIALVGWLAVKDIALLLAATSGLTNIVEALIIVGANVNSRLDISLFENQLVTTPLIQAIPNGGEKPEIIDVLLKNKANVNVDNGFGWTPLLEAVNQNDLNTVKLLVQYGANINHNDSHGWTPLMIASNNGNLTITEFLLNNNAEVDKLDILEQTALMLAIKKGYPYIVKALLDKKAKTNIVDSNGKTPLSIAAEGGDSYIADLLIKNGADVNYQDSTGFTALMIATINNNQAFIKELLEAGAKVDIKDSTNHTAIDLASSKNYSELVVLMLKYPH